MDPIEFTIILPVDVTGQYEINLQERVHIVESGGSLVFEINSIGPVSNLSVKISRNGGPLDDVRLKPDGDYKATCSLINITYNARIVIFLDQVTLRLPESGNNAGFVTYPSGLKTMAAGSDFQFWIMVNENYDPSTLIVKFINDYVVSSETLPNPVPDQHGVYGYSVTVQDHSSVEVEVQKMKHRFKVQGGMGYKLYSPLDPTSEVNEIDQVYDRGTIPAFFIKVEDGYDINEFNVHTTPSTANNGTVTRGSNNQYGWYYYVSDFSGDVEVTIEAGKLRHTVVVLSGDGFSTDPLPGVYRYEADSRIDVTVHALMGYDINSDEVSVRLIWSGGEIDFERGTQTANTFSLDGINGSGTISIYVPKMTYSISYSPNGGRGTLPDTAIVEYQGSYTVSSAASLVKSGYTFGGWASSHDASSADMSNVRLDNISRNYILYAYWVPIKITITYNVNGGTGEAPVSTVVGVDYSDSTSFVAAMRPAGMVFGDSSFSNWNTSPYGSGEMYVPGSTYSLPTTEYTTLYAWWTNFVIFTGNAEGASIVPPIIGTVGDNAFKFPEGPTHPKGFTFVGWYDPSVPNVLYGAGDILEIPSQSIAYYAEWRWVDVNTDNVDEGIFDFVGDVQIPENGSYDFELTVKDGHTGTYDVMVTNDVLDWGNPLIPVTITGNTASFSVADSGTGTLYIKTEFKTTEVTVTFDPGNGVETINGNSSGSISVDFNGDLPLTYAYAPGYDGAPVELIYSTDNGISWTVLTGNTINNITVPLTVSSTDIYTVSVRQTIGTTITGDGFVLKGYDYEFTVTVQEGRLATAGFGYTPQSSTALSAEPGTADRFVVNDVGAGNSTGGYTLYVESGMIETYAVDYSGVISLDPLFFMGADFVNSGSDYTFVVGLKTEYEGLGSTFAVKYRIGVSGTETPVNTPEYTIEASLIHDTIYIWVEENDLYLPVILATPGNGVDAIAVDAMDDGSGGYKIAYGSTLTITVSMSSGYDGAPVRVSYRYDGGPEQFVRMSGQSVALAGIHAGITISTVDIYKADKTTHVSPSVTLSGADFVIAGDTYTVNATSGLSGVNPIVVYGFNETDWIPMVFANNQYMTEAVSGTGYTLFIKADPGVTYAIDTTGMDEYEALVFSGNSYVPAGSDYTFTVVLNSPGYTGMFVTEYSADGKMTWIELILDGSDSGVVTAAQIGTPADGTLYLRAVNHSSDPLMVPVTLTLGNGVSAVNGSYTVLMVQHGTLNYQLTAEMSPGYTGASVVYSYTADGATHPVTGGGIPSVVTAMTLYTVPIYKVSYSSVRGTSPSAEFVIEGGSVTTAAMSDIGTHRFYGWSIDSSAQYISYGAGITYPVSEMAPGSYEITLYAFWIDSSGTEIYLIYVSNGGSDSIPRVGYSAGEYATVTSIIPTRSGYIFTGWLGEDNRRYAAGSSILMNDTFVLIAQWSEEIVNQTFTITSAADPGAVISPAGNVTVGIFGSVTFEFSAKEGYSLSDIIIDGVSYPQFASLGHYTFENVIGDHTIEVKNVKTTIVLDISIDGNGRVEYSVNGGGFEEYSEPVTMAADVNVTLRAYAGNGHHFVNWSGTASGSDSEIQILNVRDSIQMNAAFEENGLLSGISGMFMWLLLLLLILLVIAMILIYSRDRSTQ
ncbi:MAG: InlB B-repeat-containing protein [Candidatus Methanoplasma sp.]|nr:InlB B-repeat-containing protein [Candidatus Methanoplasma sp.]